MTKAPKSEQENPAEPAGRESRAGDFDQFAKVHESYHECASAVTAQYWSDIQRAYRDYATAVEAAQTIRDPELRREALQAAADKYGQECRTALETASRNSENCYLDYLRSLREAWQNVDVQRVTTGALASITQATFNVAWRASGNCVY